MLRHTYRGGEKAFVDYAGPKFEVVDRDTGEVREVMVVVGVLAASNYTFADLTWSRSPPDWTKCRTFGYSTSGVPPPKGGGKKPHQTLSTSRTNRP